MGLIWDLYGFICRYMIYMDSYGNYTGLLWDLYWIYRGFTWIYMGCIWDLWFLYGIYMGRKWIYI